MGTEIKGRIVAGGNGVQVDDVSTSIYAPIRQAGDITTPSFSAQFVDQFNTQSFKSGDFSWTPRLVVSGQLIRVEASKDGYHKAVRERVVTEEDLHRGWIDFGDIALTPTHRTIKGKVFSHGRPVASVKIYLTLDGTRLPIYYSYRDGSFDFATEKEGGTLSGIVRKLGYKSREISPRPVDRSAIELDLGTIELEPWWHNLHPWVGRIMDAIRQNWLIFTLLAVVLLFAVIYWIVRCPKNADPTNFARADGTPVNEQARNRAFNECEGRNQCDKNVIECMRKRGYRYSRQ